MKQNPINIVLVSPQIPQNTGNIARTCAATGAALHLVRPLGFEVDDKKLKRAGLDYWYLLDITYHDGWESFSAGRTGRFFFFTTKASSVYSRADFTGDEPVYLVFGREDAGLPRQILDANWSSCVRIPMINEARSLNLSNSVAVAVYEALRQRGFDQAL